AAGYRRCRGAAANRMGPCAADPGGGPRRGRRGGDGPPVSPARLPGAVHYRGHAPGAGHLDQAAGRGGLRRARRRVRAGRRLPGEGRGAVQREAGQGAGRGLPFGGQLRLRPLAAGRARVRPCVLRPVLPARSPLPRPDTRPLRHCGSAPRLTPGPTWCIAAAVAAAYSIFGGKRHPARECTVTYLSALDLGGSHSAFCEPRLGMAAISSGTVSVAESEPGSPAPPARTLADLAGMDDGALLGIV